MKTAGVFIIAAWIEGGRILAPFVLCEDLNADAIIGMNVIRRFGLYPTAGGRIGYIRQLATVTPELGEAPGFLIVRKAVMIAPFEARLVKTQLRDSQFATVKCRTDFIGTQHDLEFAQVTNDDGTCQVYLRNPSPHEWKVQRGEIVATAETMPTAGSATTAELATLSEQIFATDNKCNTTTKPPTPSGILRKAINERIEATVMKFPAHVRTEARSTFRKYSHIFSTSKTDLGLEPHTEHEIKLRSAEPAYAKQFSIPDAHMETIKTHVRDWLKLGIVESTKSPFNAPIFCVPKKEGHGLRVVLDYRRLNAATLPGQILHAHRGRLPQRDRPQTIAHQLHDRPHIRLLADATGQGREALHSLHDPRVGPVPVDTRSNGTDGLSGVVRTDDGRHVCLSREHYSIHRRPAHPLLILGGTCATPGSRIRRARPAQPKGQLGQMRIW